MYASTSTIRPAVCRRRPPTSLTRICPNSHARPLQSVARRTSPARRYLAPLGAPPSLPPLPLPPVRAALHPRPERFSWFGLRELVTLGGGGGGAAGLNAPAPVCALDAHSGSRCRTSPPSNRRGPRPRPPRPPRRPRPSAFAAFAAFAALAVLSAGPAIPATPTAATTTTTATLGSLLAGSRRGGRWARRTSRRFGSHHIAAWPEVGIDFHHAILGISETPPAPGRRAPPREPRRKRALRIGMPPCVDGGAIGVAAGQTTSASECRLRLLLGRWGRQDRARGLRLVRHRLFLLLEGAGSSSVPIPTACLNQSERAAEREPGLCGRGFRLLGRGRLSGSCRQFFTVASAASRPRPASPTPATGFLGVFAHRGERRRRRRACDLRAEGDFVLPVVESGQRDETTTGRLRSRTC